jgi:hypothetical protein
MTSSNLLKTAAFLAIATLFGCESRTHDEAKMSDKAAPVASGLPAIPTEPTLVEVSADGFQPPHVTLTGTHQLVFRRTSDQTCATEVVFPALGIDKKLPLNTDVLVDLPPNAAGEVAFQCGMGMYRGSVVAK